MAFFVFYFWYLHMRDARRDETDSIIPFVKLNEMNVKPKGKWPVANAYMTLIHFARYQELSFKQTFYMRFAVL